jgi:hypothetical protein
MKFKSFKIVQMCLMNKTEFHDQNFATIISVRFTLLLEKGRARIREAQKHTDPIDPHLDSDPEHWLPLFQSMTNSKDGTLYRTL